MVSHLSSQSSPSRDTKIFRRLCFLDRTERSARPHLERSLDDPTRFHSTPPACHWSKKADPTCASTSLHPHWWPLRFAGVRCCKHRHKTSPASFPDAECWPLPGTSSPKVTQVLRLGRPPTGSTSPVKNRSRSVPPPPPSAELRILDPEWQNKATSSFRPVPPRHQSPGRKSTYHAAERSDWTALG